MAFGRYEARVRSVLQSETTEFMPTCAIEDVARRAVLIGVEENAPISSVSVERLERYIRQAYRESREGARS
jgi:hypothetical protein